MRCRWSRVRPKNFHQPTIHTTTGIFNDLSSNARGNPAARRSLSIHPGFIEMNTTYTLLTRAKKLVNTDPQRRCYNGCHFSSELVWTEWGVLESGLQEDQTTRRMKFWKELNDYAVSQRGESALREFKLEPEDL